MRAVLVVPSLRDPAHRRVARALRRELPRAGVDVSVFRPRDGLSMERSRRGLAALLRRSRARVCHVQFFSRGLAYLAGFRPPPGVRLVLTHQGAELGLIERPSVFSGLLRRAAAVTSVSRGDLLALRRRPQLGAGRLAWIPNGADAPPLTRREMRPARPFILSVGRLAAYKGIDVLLMAFAALSRERPDLDLVVCGPDQTGGRMARFVARLGLARRVRLLGDVPAPRVRALLARCQFFVLPSRRENMPMALLEAMAAGKPSVASDVGGVREALRHRVDGLRVPPGDVAALTRAMGRLAEDAGLRRRMGRAARRRAARYGWSEVARRYARLYAAVAGKERTASSATLRRKARPSVSAAGGSPQKQA